MKSVVDVAKLYINPEMYRTEYPNIKRSKEQKAEVSLNSPQEEIKINSDFEKQSQVGKATGLAYISDDMRKAIQQMSKTNQEDVNTIG